MKPLEILLVVLLSVGALQGVIYGVILWNKQSLNNTANKFLAAILFFFSYRLIVEILKLFDIGIYDFWYHVVLEFNWIYGALIYFFVKALVTPNFKLHIRKDWIHFLPVIIEFLWSNYIKTQNFYWDGTRESLSWLGYYGYVVWMQYPTQYIICTVLIIFYSLKAEKLLQLSNSKTTNIIKDRTKWIVRVLLILRIYSILIILVVLTDLFFFDYAFNKSYHYPVFIGMALVTYWLGIEGFNKKNEMIVKVKSILDPKEALQLNQIASKLKKLMQEEKLFKNPDLNLTGLSKQLDIKPYLTTKCLNIIFEKKFNDFINEYRIEELKNLLKNSENNKYTLLSLAFESGFNSKASFNRAVKKLTGKSPSSLKSSIK
jgi:AraC-like DNA-binding protein